MRRRFSSFLLMIACAGTLVAQTIPVSDAAGLAAMVTQCTSDGCAGKTYVLTADIDLSTISPWTPIGSSTNPFQGRLNGQGHLIKGLHLFNGKDGIGLFGYVGASGRIDSVGICGSSIIAKNKRRIGAIAGVCSGHINQCWSMAYMPAAGNVVGGLVGELTKTGTITDAYHSGLIYNANDTIGGIVGMNDGGTLTRVYNTGYAKNGKAIVGMDKGGKYPECYYDRKLYYQESGIENDQYTPVDVTEQMFSLYGTREAWWLDIDRYPILSAFAGTDAALLSAAPMYVEPEWKDPVNHANDLTKDFTLYTKNSVTWKCQDKRSEDWIQINGSLVHVIRPCTETDVLVDVKKGTETRVVYMRPRRVEDLQPGLFNPSDGKPMHGYCFEANEPIKGQVFYTPASLGWTESDYHYLVVRYELTPTDTIVKDTLLDDANSVQYEAWFNTDTIPTNEPGHYIIRSYVHDDGCVQDWLENKAGLEYIVFEPFNPGVIVSGKDTVILTTNPYEVTIQDKTPASGGGGPITYQWQVNGTDITGTDKVSLTYSLTKSGIYTFTRTARDSANCCEDKILADGAFTYYVFDPLDPGDISKPNEVEFCTVEEAKAYIAKTTAATGGVTDKGYSYQWYSVSGTDTIAIKGATSQNLDMKNLPLVAGQSYVFVRKAWDNTRFTTWTLSRKSLSIYIKKTLSPGSIQDGALPNECVAHDAMGKTTITVTVQEKTAASGEGNLEYRWVRNPGNKIVGNERELSYTFPLSEITLNTTYTYVRYVRNPGCDWLQSEGSATQYYGRKSYGEVTITVCAEHMPYSMTWVDGKTYTFTKNGETQLLTDTRGECPADTLFKVVTAKMPAFKMDTIARFCQETGTITLNYEATEGAMNIYRVIYSPALALIIGSSGASGTITTDNTIVLTNIPPLGIGDYYIDLQLGYADTDASDAGVCFSTAHRMVLKPSLGGYIHSKYDRVLFVDNNPDNNLIPGAADKLKFVGYQWYRNGIRLEGETQQYYHEGGRALNGIYYVELTSEDGGMYRSCDVTIQPDSTASAPKHSLVYPIPVGAGQPLTIEAEGTVLIRSFAGETVTPMVKVNGKTPVTAPYMPGLYYVQITAPDGTVEMHKLIVQ
ncbi:MAG: PKD domain-containing protein [Paludibacteraceae bacterium]|nr:PKD domain-containing protein [Paludibacteraceae bacterium]